MHIFVTFIYLVLNKRFKTQKKMPQKFLPFTTARASRKKRRTTGFLAMRGYMEMIK